MTQSSKSTDAESGKETIVRPSAEVTPSDKQIDSLSNQLEKAKDDRLEERFLWACVCAALFDALVFVSAGITAGILMFLFMVALLLVLSRRWGFEQLWETLQDVVNLFKDFLPKKDD